MALTEDQLVDIRRDIGLEPDDDTLNTIYDRVGTVDELVLEVLETRYAELLRNPSSFQVPGEYGETRSDKQLGALEDKIGALGGSAGSSPVRIVPPPDRPCR